MSLSQGKRFFCFTKDKVEGPFSLIELAGLLRAKHIEAETPLCPEGSEEWIAFRDRPEYMFATEISHQAIDQHLQETAQAAVSPWSPKKLATFLWIMAPVFLYLLYRFVRLYIIYHLTHDASSNLDTDSSGSS
jgi:hypothetical protein